MADNSYNDNNDNNNDDNQPEQMVTCSECNEVTVPEAELEDHNFYSYQPSLESNDFVHICEDCFFDMNEKPVWPVKENFDELCIECVVLAKFQDEWSRATVWNIDKQKNECTIEFRDEQKGSGVVSFDDLRPLFTFNSEGEQIQKMHKYKSYSEYLGMSSKNTDVEGVQIQDNLIPHDLKNSLTKNFDKIANFDEKDFHPGSDEKVQNLVHPSLFCYVKGVSMKNDGTIENFDENDGTPVSTAVFMRWNWVKFIGDVNFFGRNTGISKYQWLPTNFYIDNNNKVFIQDYINGLTPKEQYVDLYSDLEKVFAFFVPMFENCLEDLYKNEQYGEDQRYKNPSNKKQKPYVKKSSSVKNRTLQLFVKAANFVLQPGQMHEGVWHVEGVSQEHIIATGIYYYEVSDNIEDEGLSFRRGLTESEEKNITMQYTHENPPPFEYDSCEVELGTIHTKHGRCIMFPNSHQHKLQKLSNKSDKEIAMRKMLCFFIVDPDKTIISTAEVHDQNWKVAKIQIAFEIQKIARRILGQQFPDIVAQKILEMSKFGFTFEEAQQNRLALMQFRKFYKDEMNREIEREINLCEH